VVLVQRERMCVIKRERDGEREGGRERENCFGPSVQLELSGQIIDEH
jgi:hypothetical protein